MEQNSQDGGSRREGFLKDGTSTRSRMPSGGGRKTMPRIMWLAILVCIAGAALLFRNSGQDTPTGIGERRTVVTAPTQPDGDTPRSGEVDLEGQTQDLTPEQPAGEETPAAQEETPEETAPVATASAAPAPVTAPTTTPTTTPVQSEPPPLIEPTASGQYAVQTGAFGTPENADKEAARLKELGWDVRVRAGNSASGDMDYRVWICFFASRQVAGDFVRQESAKIPNAIVVHR